MVMNFAAAEGGAGSAAQKRSLGERRRPRVSRPLYIILAIFFGGLGLHNFYAHRTQWGLVQLAVTLVSWTALWIPLVPLYIWILIEIFTVDVDGHGNKMT